MQDAKATNNDLIEIETCRCGKYNCQKTTISRKELSRRDSDFCELPKIIDPKGCYQ